MINGTIFRQYDIRGVVGEDLTNEVLLEIGKGFGTYLRRKEKKTVVVGGDARLSTPAFKENFIKGLLQTGCEVTDIGIVATPVLYFSIWKLAVEGGAMITASHNPPQYNGIKLNMGLASVYAEELQEVLKIIQQEDFVSGEGKLVQNKTIGSDYMDYIADNISLARPVKLVVDAGVLKRASPPTTTVFFSFLRK